MLLSFLKENLRNRSVLFWIVVFPTLLFAIIYSIFMGRSSFDVDIGIYVPKAYESVVKMEINSHMHAESGFHITFFDSIEEAKSSLKKGDIAVLVYYDDDALNISYLKTSGVSSITALMIKRAIQGAMRGGDEPQVVIVRGIYDLKSHFLIGMLLMITAEIGFMYMIPTISGSIKTGLFKRFYLVGVSPVRLQITMFVVATLAAGVSSSLLMFVAYLMGAPTGVLGLRVWSVFALSLVIFCIQGIALSTVFKGSPVAELLGSMLYFLNMFLGGMVMPVPVSSSLSYWLPGYHLVNMAMGISFNMWVVLLWTLSFLVLMVVAGRGVFGIE